MARAPVYGPRRVKLRGRDLTRNRLSLGKVRQRVSKGVFVELDVSPMYLVAADALAVAADEMLVDATEHAPDDPTTSGSRIRDNGIWGVYAFGQVLETGGPGEWRKPRTFRPIKTGVDAVATFRGGLHHLHELGTVNMPARPYLGPAKMRAADALPGHLRASWPKGSA